MFSPLLLFVLSEESWNRSHHAYYTVAYSKYSLNTQIIRGCACLCSCLTPPPSLLMPAHARPTYGGWVGEWAGVLPPPSCIDLRGLLHTTTLVPASSLWNEQVQRMLKTHHPLHLLITNRRRVEWGDVIWSHSGTAGARRGSYLLLSCCS